MNGSLHALEWFVAGSIYMQTAIIMCLVVYVLILMAVRTNRRRKVARLSEIIGNRIVGELMRLSGVNDQVALFTAPVLELNALEALVFQKQLLLHMKGVTGLERNYLEHRYRLLNFEKDDMTKAKSIWWWVRLRAIANLAQIRSIRAADLLFEMRNDKNEIVAGSALLALSNLDHELNDPQKWKTLPASLLERHNVLYHIFNNVARLRGVQFLVGVIHSPPTPEFRDICLRVIFSLRSSDAVIVLCNLLKDYRGLSEATICDILSCLKEIGDPHCVPFAWPFMDSRDARIRARAGALLILLAGEQKTEILLRLRADTHGEVRRIAIDASKEAA